MTLFSINEAARQGMERVRKPIWACKFDHLKIDICDGKPGPWIHLYAPFNLQCNGRDPIDVLSVQHDLNEACFEYYAGPLPDSEEYRAQVAAFDRSKIGEGRPSDEGTLAASDRQAGE